MMIIIKLFIAKIQKKTVFEPRNLNKQWQKKSMVILMTPIANT